MAAVGISSNVMLSLLKEVYIPVSTLTAATVNYLLNSVEPLPSMVYLMNSVAGELSSKPPLLKRALAGPSGQFVQISSFD